MKKILLYGDIDLNLIDGSAVWIYSLTNVLTKNKNLKVDLLLKAKPINEEIIGEIRNNSQVNLIFNSEKQRLSPEEASEIIESLDRNNEYDFIFIRGNDILKKVKNLKANLWSYLIQIENLENDELMEITKKSKIIFLQTEEAKASFVNRIGESKDIRILPPMVNDIKSFQKPFFNFSNKLIYQGKFSEDYNSDEILEAFKELIDEGKKIYLEVLGNKFNKCLTNSEFENQIRKKLENYPYINWMGGVKKTIAEKILEENDIGISWRNNRLNDIDEISTKLLEYGRCGKPVIMNRTKVHEKIFGIDYPLFANTKNEFKEKISLAIENLSVYKKAAERMFEVSKIYTYTNIYNNVFKEFLENKNKNILFASHDFKFIDSLINKFKIHNYNVKLDQWDSHSKHDEKKSLELLEWADIIICEWGLGNAVWYSNNKKINQKLFVRVHSQETKTEFPNNYDLKNINKIIAICPSVYEEFSYNYNIPRNKISLIYNYLDEEKLVDKNSKKNYNNFGMVGICPKMKRLDLALDIFEKILCKNKEAKLYIKGKKPQEYEWLWKKEDEQNFYNDIFKRLESKEILKKAVIFEGFSNNMGEWYGKIGFLLSTSDYEGSHQAVAESMRAGCIPIIRNWKNAKYLYPAEYIFENQNEGVELVLKFKNKNKNELIKTSKKNQNYAKIKYDLDIIFKEWLKLMEIY